MELLLYSTSGCHLCDVAQALLDDINRQTDNALAYRVVEIADDDALVERYGMSIPVLFRTDSQSTLPWPFSLPELAQFMEA